MKALLISKGYWKVIRLSVDSTISPPTDGVSNDQGTAHTPDSTEGSGD